MQKLSARSSEQAAEIQKLQTLVRYLFVASSLENFVGFSCLMHGWCYKILYFVFLMVLVSLHLVLSDWDELMSGAFTWYSLYVAFIKDFQVSQIGNSIVYKICSSIFVCFVSCSYLKFMKGYTGGEGALLFEN